MLSSNFLRVGTEQNYRHPGEGDDDFPRLYYSFFVQNVIPAPRAYMNVVAVKSP